MGFELKECFFAILCRNIGQKKMRATTIVALIMIGLAYVLSHYATGMERQNCHSFLRTTAGFMRVMRRVCRAVTAAETAQMRSRAAMKMSGLRVIRCA